MGFTHQSNSFRLVHQLDHFNKYRGCVTHSSHPVYARP